MLALRLVRLEKVSQLSSFIMAAKGASIAPSKDLANSLGASLVFGVNNGSSLASPDGGTSQPAGSVPSLNLATSPGAEAALIGGSARGGLRRSSRRTLNLAPPTPDIGLPPVGASYGPTAHVPLNAASGAPAEEATLGKDGVVPVPVVMPKTPTRRASARSRKSPKPAASPQEEAAKAVKKAKVLQDAAVPLLDPGAVTDEIGVLAALPVPRSLLDEEVMRAAIDHLRTAHEGGWYTDCHIGSGCRQSSPTKLAPLLSSDTHVFES